MDALGWAVVALIAMLVVFLVVSYNRLVRLRNQIETAWSQIGAQLERRYELIPDLVKTVKPFAAHERKTFESVTRARQQATSAAGVEERAQAESLLTQTLRQLFAVAEAYPELKANEGFLNLQEELAGTEGRIGFARQFYNERVLAYDNTLEAFPSNLVANTFRFKRKPYFEAEAASREPASVDSGPRRGSGAPPATAT